MSNGGWNEQSQYVILEQQLEVSKARLAKHEAWFQKRSKFLNSEIDSRRYERAFGETYKSIILVEELEAIQRHLKEVNGRL